MNPGAMNPIRYHNLQEKKKLLWSKKKVGLEAIVFVYCLFVSLFVCLFLCFWMSCVDGGHTVQEGPSRNKWEMASIEGEETQTTKFRRLMGISKCREISV